MLFNVQDLFFTYFLDKQKVEAIRGLNLMIEPHCLSAISGPSGSGKSTLLNILGLIEPLQKGKVFFLGEDVAAFSEKRKNAIRKKRFGFIFQQFHLIPVLSAEENVSYFLARQGLSSKEARLRSQEALESTGLWEQRKQRPAELSGGQKQRVAIARAIAKRPDVIIADEPTASLDRKTGREIMDILKGLVLEKKSSIILTTHDPMVLSYTDRQFHLVDGSLS